MKLDRNINRGGRGKYALVNMRKLIPLLDKRDNGGLGPMLASEADIICAFECLVSVGVISLGNETPGDQFFVVKYKDMFAHGALQGYADAIREYLRREPKGAEQIRIGSELNEFLWQMDAEADKASKLGNRIPD